MSNILTYIVSMLQTSSLFVRILFLGSLPALLTFLGTLPVLYGKSLDERIIDAGMGFSAGIMLVASFTSLLIPAMDLGGLHTVVLGFVLGAVSILVIDKLIPHEHVIRGYEGPKRFGHIRRKSLLIALAMIVHNIPEGMAVGVAAIYDLTGGIVLAIAIGFQDIPEGLAVAIPIYASTGRKGHAIFVGGLSGLFELLSAFVPLAIITVSSQALGFIMPFLMAIAAGAMIYVVVHEIIPEIYGHGHDESSTLGFFLGFVLMLLLDFLL
ncbi:MAG: ZIP family metal transporter [Candidatus Aenigmatarchaeota archaeon]|nr:MAG: ZIP family metal transporter [Candidatus Aenigmarchaeota archaeon]